jgi:DNA-binding Xre family transcriptional regulator
MRNLSLLQHPLPKRPHRALLWRRATSPEWMVADGMELLGGWIRESRVQAGMTQGQLARLAGMHQSTLSRLERGTLEGLRLHRLAAIISVLHSRLGDDLRPIVA